MNELATPVHGFVYIWINRQDNHRAYIGSHKGHPCDGYKASGTWINYAFQEFGMGAFERHIVYEGPDFYEIETIFIEFFDACNSCDFYNSFHICRAGGGRLSTDMTGANNPMANPEVRAKHQAAVNDPRYKAKKSAAAKAMWSDPEMRAKQSAAMTGRPASDATREMMSGETNPAKRLEVRNKLSAAMTGRLVSDETREKLSAAMTGKTASDETRAKMSAAKFGKDNPMECPDVRARHSAAVKEVQSRPGVKAAHSAANLKKFSRPIVHELRELAVSNNIKLGSGWNMHSDEWINAKIAELTYASDQNDDTA